MMLNEGNYRGRPVRAALGQTSTGKEQIAVEFDFVDPPGTRRTWYGFFTDATFDRTIDALRACGWAGTDLTDFCGEQPPPGFDQEVELVVKHEEYNGQVRDRIAFINGGGGLALKAALDANQARAFAARLKGRIAAADVAAGRAPAPAKPPVKAATAKLPRRPAAPPAQPEPDEAARAKMLEEQSKSEDVPW